MKEWWTGRSTEEKKECEGFLAQMMTRYWVDAKAITGMESTRLKVVAGALVKATKALCSQKGDGQEEQRVILISAEAKIREKLTGKMELPQPIPVTWDVKKPADAASTSSKGNALPSITFTDEGTLVVNISSRFHQIGGEIGKPVHLKRKWGEYEKLAEGLVEQVDNKGVHVRFPVGDSTKLEVCPVGVLQPGAVKKKAKKDTKQEVQEPVVPGSVGYRLVSAAQSYNTVQCAVSMSLYKLLASSGSAPPDVLLCGER